jgi:hypothetical protein
LAAPPAGTTKVLIRPDALTLSAHGPLSGVVAAVTFRGESTTLLIRPTGTPDGPLLEAHLKTADSTPPVVGQTVALSVDPSAVVFLP